MAVIFIVTTVFFFIVVILFAFPRFSPIPYYPTNKKDLPLIIKALNLKNNQVIIDLGAGDGVVIFSAASNAVSQPKKLNTRFIAVDINPVLVFIMHLRRLFHPNRKNIKIIWKDLFKIKYNSLTREPVNSLTFYLYVSPWLLEQIVFKTKKDFGNYNIVSYFYPVISLKNKEKIIQGKNKVFIYQITNNN